MNGFAKTCGFIVIVCVACVLLAACGGSGGKASPGTIVPSVEQDQGVDIAAILAAPVPDGVEPELWEMLTRELVGEILRTSAPQPYEIEYGWVLTGVGASWSNKFMRVDGSGDGAVDIADLVPIAEHYGEEWADGEDGPSYADYSGGRRIDVWDVAPLARDWGLSCSGFRVEFSTTSADEGFAVAGTVDYDDYADIVSGWSRHYKFPCETRGLEPLWVKICALDNAGQDLGYEVWEAPLTELDDPFGGAPDSYPQGEFELSLLGTQPPVVTWSTTNLLPDGNQDGVVNDFELGSIADWFCAITAEEPLSTVADYDGNGTVGISDVTGLAIGIHDGYSVGSFVVEVSAMSAEDGFVADGTVDYFDSAGFNEFGFRYYEYQIQSPPENLVYWVRVVPYSVEDERGAPGAVVQVEG